VAKRAAKDTLGGLFAPEGPLASAKSGYRERPQQVGLAREVAKTFKEKGVLLSDAPTGTGKSLAYLAPTILSGEKVVVSTATLALQHQLLAEDLPPLKKAACSLLGYPEDEGFSYAVMKGRSNFLCGQRHEDTLRAGSILDGELLAGLDRWAAETETGDREDLPFPVPAATWMEVASDGEDCAPNACRFRDGCFYYAHRDVAAEADLIIVNHALLLANVAAAGNIFEAEGRHLVIDEAHRLEEVMAEALGARVSYGRVRYVARQAKKKSEGAADPADRAEMAAEAFFGELREGGELGSERHAPPSYETLVDALALTKRALAADPKEEANNLTGMVGRLSRDLKAFYTEPEETHVYAVVPGRSRDPSRKPYPELRSWLVDTAEAFREWVLPTFEGGGVVLASATLANGSGGGRSFSYARRRLGLEEHPGGRRVAEHAGGEVFDYGERCLLYVEEGIEEPKLGTADLYAEACARRTEELVGISRGRALVLLSTSRAVRAFREAFRPPYPVRFQGDDAPGRLVRWLKATEGAVLVGTRTFWEGVDVPGDAVSLVVIDRAPFPPPDDPVVAKLCERAGKGWFREVSLPRAQVALRQGAGRLMRRPDDRGVIALLDPRIRARGWGKSVLSALPPAPVTGSLEVVRRFFGAGSRRRVSDEGAAASDG
jgi:ATP-dependent DNA helicase DinG